MSTYLVHGITDCPACLRACALLMEQDREYVFVETDYAPTYRHFLKEKYKWNTYPIVVELVGNEEGYRVVGGYDQLTIHLKEKAKNEAKEIVTTCSLKLGI